MSTPFPAERSPWKATHPAVTRFPLFTCSAAASRPPQTISDSEDGEEEANPRAAREALPAVPPNQLQPPGPLPNDELVRLAALTSEEVACQERLRYIGQTLPRAEALLGFLRQEEQNALAQFEMIRAAKSRLISALSQGKLAPLSRGSEYGRNEFILKCSTFMRTTSVDRTGRRNIRRVRGHTPKAVVGPSITRPICS